MKKIKEIAKEPELEITSDETKTGSPYPTEPDAYLEINQASFKENFKTLIGHYQSMEPEDSRAA